MTPALDPRVRAFLLSERAREATRRFLADQGFATTARRIRRIAFSNRGDPFDLEVGGHHPGMEDEWPVDGREEEESIRCLVCSIFEGVGGDCFYLCLPYRGVLRNYPWLVRAEEATAVEDEAAPPAAPLPAAAGEGKTGTVTR